MKSTIVMGIVAASLLLTGCGKMSNTLTERTAAGVATNQVVGYARIDRITTTNIFLTVSEIWKGLEQASRLGITNGMDFPEAGDHIGGSPPEGAVFLLSVDTNRQTSSEEIIWVRSGQVEHMTVQEFKAKIGL
jgi:hypothetical protein